MSIGLNQSLRDAWILISQHIGLWLIFWFLLGVAEQVGWAVFENTVAEVQHQPAATSSIPQPSVPQTPQTRLKALEEQLTLRGPIDRSSSEPTPSQARLIAAAIEAAEHAPAFAVVESDQEVFDSKFTAGAPPGFSDLIGLQNTEADVYFQNRLITSTFIEYDLEHVVFLAPEEVIEAIPTLKNPERVLAVLAEELDSNSRLLCNARVRTECGELEPDIAGVIFNESKFRIDLFVAQDEQEVQLLLADRYLPAPSADWATLHDMSFTASGAFGSNRYNLSGESFLSKGEGRARVRYGLTNSGAALHEASWQWDKQGREYELGAFRSARGNSLFVNDRRLLGVRFGSSTNTRTDLDNALATPVFAFLERRSRVDILRDGEILDTRFYAAGNHQIDTTRLPDGAYDITLRTVSPDGAVSEEVHFFVRDSLLPPLGEQQYFLEAGAFTEAFGSDLPRLTGGGWLRGGLSRRLSERFALEGGALVSDEVGLLQAGAYLLGRGWQLHAGVMGSNRGDTGVSLRGQLQRKSYVASFSGQHLNSKTPIDFSGTQDSLSRLNPLLGSNVDFSGLTSEQLGDELLDTQPVLGGSFTQASASLSFPLRIPLWNGRFSAGRGNFQARYNRRNGSADAGIGFNYRAPLFKRGNMAADVNFEGLYSDNRSLVRLGFDLRWRNRGQSSVVSPELLASSDVDPQTNQLGSVDVTPSISANWNRNRRSERFGQVGESLFVSHDGQRTVLGSRLSAQTKYGYSDLDVSWQEGLVDGFSYAANSRFSLVSTDGKPALGGGNRNLAAIVVEIDGDLPDVEFQVIVGSRVAGYASTGKRGVVSVRPYERYSVKIQPTGDRILGYDERSYDVTLFPGNVHRLVFAARSLHVLVSQAVKPDGSPLMHGRFTNVEGFGVTDSAGWFQVEVAHNNPLSVRLPSGEFCELTPPPPEPDDNGLAVLDALVCRPIPAPPSE